MEPTSRTPKPPMVIAGPCSVESREQLQAISRQLAAMPEVAMVRAGVWKPRTRPGGFEGLGEPALRWMSELQAELGVAYCCEVARPEHVDLCQQYGIRTVWIGARTTENPFMVEELCAALRGSGMAVMVKNPMCPDVRLWLGAVERLQQAGIEQVTAIHRGFSMYPPRHGSVAAAPSYRNEPLWEVALELRREMPALPIVCDPSHMGGQRDLVEPLARTAMLLDYDGLMVEVHPTPEAALTDAAQQLSVEALAAMLGRIAKPHTTAAGADQGLLWAMRQQIDEVDHDMIRLLARRMALSKQMAGVKQALGMTAYQSKRWEQVMRDRLQMAGNAGLDLGFMRDLLEKLHAESLRIQLAESERQQQ